MKKTHSVIDSQLPIAIGVRLQLISRRLFISLRHFENLDRIAHIDQLIAVHITGDLQIIRLRRRNGIDVARRMDAERERRNHAEESEHHERRTNVSADESRMCYHFFLL